MNKCLQISSIFALTLLMTGQAHAQQAAATVSDMPKAEARRLLDAFYKTEETTARSGDIEGSAAPFAEDARITFNGSYYTGRAQFVALYPKGYKDIDYRIESLNTVVTGDEIYHLAAVHGRTPGPGKAYLMFYHFKKRGNALEIVDLVSSTVNEAALKR